MTWVPQGYALITLWLTALSKARKQPAGGWMYEFWHEIEDSEEAVPSRAANKTPE
jgi:hypothetical protein